MKTIKEHRGPGNIKVAIAHAGKPCHVCGNDDLSEVKFVQLTGKTQSNRSYFRICDECLETLARLHHTLLEAQDNVPTVHRSVRRSADTDPDSQVYQLLRTGTDASRGVPVRRPRQRPERSNRVRR